MHGQQQVVDPLRHLPGAQRTEVDDRVGERLEDGSARGQGRLGATGHEEEPARRGGRPAAADGRVDHGDAPLVGARREGRARTGKDRGVDRHDTARRHAGQHAVRSQEHVLDVGIGEDADAHDLARGADLGRRGRHGCRGVGEGFGGFRTPGPERERMAVLHDAPRHGRALATESDEAHACHAVTSDAALRHVARVARGPRCVLLVSDVR